MIEAIDNGPPRDLAEGDPARLERLGRRLTALESIRAIKRVQIAYAQFAEFGLWDEMAALFARDGVLDYGDATAQGPAAIADWFRTSFGAGRDGLAPAALHTHLALTPVINLAADGRSALGRWHELSMLCTGADDARWAGGIQENEYRIEDGAWKIARLRHYPMYAGSYEDGWRNLEPHLAVVPYHFTPAEAGTPIPALVEAPGGDPAPGARAIERRLGLMRDEDLVRNLQNAYGYYVDQKLWTDVTDLFTPDGTVEVAGLGIWQGEQGIRRLLQRDGASGLRHGEVNEHLQLHTLVTVSPDGREAWARGLDLGMLGRNRQWGLWTHATFSNHYVKQDGVWRIAAMRLFPKLRADYYQGWGKSRLPEPALRRGYEPERPSGLPALGEGLIPAFDFPNPATALPVAYPAGTRAIGADPAAMRAATAAPGDGEALAIEELERRLAVEEAYDATENVSSAFGDYLDDFDWDNSAALFARTGRREKYQVGFYVGPERIRQADLTGFGRPVPPRTYIQIHIRTQPVIDVAPDGRSTKLRTRLFSWNSMRDTAGWFQSGMYPSDRMVLEDGAWKFQHQAINELYFGSNGYKGGWANVPEPNPNQFAPDRKPTVMDKLRAAFPPDVHTADLGVRGFSFAPGEEFIEWPGIKPMWFHYVNPVSGRVPPNYCPDESTCYQPRPLFEDQ